MEKDRRDCVLLQAAGREYEPEVSGYDTFPVYRSALAQIKVLHDAEILPESFLYATTVLGNKDRPKKLSVPTRTLLPYKTTLWKRLPSAGFPRPTAQTTFGSANDSERAVNAFFPSTTSASINTRISPLASHAPKLRPIEMPLFSVTTILSASLFASSIVPSFELASEAIISNSFLG